MRLTTRCFLFSAFLLMPFTVSCRSATSLISASAWTTHNDPAARFSPDANALRSNFFFWGERPHDYQHS